MLIANNYEVNLRFASELALSSIDMKGEKRADTLLRAMRHAHHQATKMRYHGEFGTQGASHAVDCLEITWITARDCPHHPALEDMVRTSATACREMGIAIPPRVDHQARRDQEERTKQTADTVRRMAPIDVRETMRAEAQLQHGTAGK